MFRSSLSLAVVASLLLARGAAAETAPPTALSWVTSPGAESCGSAMSVGREVEERLHKRVLVSASAAEHSLEVRVDASAAPQTWRASLLLRGGAGEIMGTRQLESAAPDCSSLRQEVTLAIALMIDPEALSRPIVPPSPRSSPVEAARPAPSPPAADRPAAPSPWGVEASANGSIVAGMLPSAAAGAVLRAGVRLPWAITVAAFVGEWSAQRVGETAGSVLIAPRSVGLEICPVAIFFAGRAEATACAGVAETFFALTPDNEQVQQSGVSTEVDVFVEPSLRYRIVGPLAARVGGAVGLGVARSQIHYDAADVSTDLFLPSLVNVRGEIGLALQLP